jgi:hypothetical protein
MTTWQAERFALEHQTEVIRVECSFGTFSGRACGVRFDPRARRLCLRLHERRGECRSIPVAAISALDVA